MINKHKRILPLFLLFSITLMTGCNNTSLSENEISSLESYVVSLLDKETINVNELESKISYSIPRIKDKDEASRIMNTYIYILYNEASNYLPYFDIIGQELVSIKNKLGIDKVDVSMYKKISSESKIIGAIFEEMYNLNLMVVDENNTFFTEVNVQKILDEYRNYLNDDIVEFLDFRATENSIPMYDVNTDEYNLDVLLERASISIKKSKENTSSEQIENWRTTASYYYELLLAENTDQFLEDRKVTNEYIKELKDKLKKYKDSQIYTDFNKYIELLESNNNDIDNDDVVAYRNSLFESIFSDNSTKEE